VGRIRDSDDDRVEAERECVFEGGAGVRDAVPLRNRLANNGRGIRDGDELEEVTLVPQRRGMCGLPDEAGPEERDAKARRLALRRHL
jgi:hypothetical protein